MSVLGAAAITGGLGLAGSLISGSQSRAEARKNRAFQERMSNTAYQRAADDMEAAGLNRILAIGSPATTPGGAVAQIPDYGASISQGINVGANVASSAKQISKIDEEIRKIVEETELTKTRAGIALLQSSLWQEIAPILAQAGRDFGDLMNMLKSIVPDLKNYVMGLPIEIAKEMDRVLREIYGSRYRGSTLEEVFQ